MQRKLFKFVVIGDSSVGKSALLAVYRGEDFAVDHLATIGVDFYTYETHFKDQKVNLQLWDTAGEERYRSVSTTYFRGAHAVFIVYDVNNHLSFDNLSKWLIQAKNAADSAKLVLVGNKCDLERKVSQQEAENFAETNNMVFFETSAKENQGVTEVFDKMVEILCQDFPSVEKGKDNTIPEIQKVEAVEDQKEAKSGCC